MLPSCLRGLRLCSYSLTLTVECDSLLTPVRLNKQIRFRNPGLVPRHNYKQTIRIDEEKPLLHTCSIFIARGTVRYAYTAWYTDLHA